MEEAAGKAKGFEWNKPHAELMGWEKDVHAFEGTLKGGG